MIAYKAETAWGETVPGSMVAPHDATERWSGARPYYRRTQPNGWVVVYFRDSAGRYLGSITADPRVAALIPSGRSYTIEQTTTQGSDSLI